MKKNSNSQNIMTTKPNPESNSSSVRDAADSGRPNRLLNYTLHDDLVRSWLRSVDRKPASAVAKRRRICVLVACACIAGIAILASCVKARFAGNVSDGIRASVPDAHQLADNH
jgi:hypothetical protein